MIALVTLLLTTASPAVDWQPWLQAPPTPVLSREFHALCRQPCEYIGFPFTYTDPEHAAIRLTGANALGLGAMWNPVMDPSAPYGCGAITPDGAGVLAQTFTATGSFDRVAPSLPTGTSTDSGCSWELFASSADDPFDRLVASGSWPLLVDNAFAEATFDPQPAGPYALRISRATGSWVGWWARANDPYPGGQAWEGAQPRAGVDLELRIGLAGQWQDLVAPGGDHMAIRLGPFSTDSLRRHDLVANYSVGDWNNPGFPYLPDWFNERFPEALALDQNGQRIMGGMFDKAVPAPGIEAPVLVDGATRFIKQVVSSVGDDPTILYWVMGGEDLYATYCYPDRWTDYSELAIVHFRRWLQTFRYPTIEALNEAWGSAYASFDTVEPPRAPAISHPWRDWLDFRFQSMGERFAWHYRAARSQDPRRLVVSCNHGTLYAGNMYAAMGACPELYAANSDGYETGQIMSDDDPELYNIMYMETLNSLGKPYCPVRLAYKKSDPKARGGGISYTPESARRYVYEALGGDAWHLGLIQWSGSLPDGEWGVVGTPAQPAISELFGEIHRLQPQLQDMHALSPRLAVYLSHPTWALRGFSRRWTDFHVAAVRRQVPKLYVYDGQIIAGDLRPDQIVLSMDNSLVDPGVIAALLAHARRGGQVVIAGRFADETDGSGPLPPEVLAQRDQLMALARVIPEADPASIMASLGDAVRPVDLSTDDIARRVEPVDIAPRAEDWPQDLTEGASLGQTFRVTGDGLESIAIRTPTYYRVPEFGFHLEALLGGPDGEVIASRDIPAGISDNSWQKLAVTTPPPVGSTVYVRATADAQLPATRIGWWSTHRDTYAEGTAFVNDEPVGGDRGIALRYQSPVPANECVEVFILTDGLNYGVVLINLSPTPISLRTDISRLLPPGAAAPFAVTTPLHPAQWQGQGLQGTVALPPNGTAYLNVRSAAGAADAAELVARAAEATQRWQAAGALTDYARHATERAATTLAQGQAARACAMALNTLNQLGMELSVEVLPSGGLAIEGTCYDAVGNPAALDGAVLKLVPSPAFSRPLTPTGPGRFALTLGPRDLPPAWDYAAGQYVPCHGPLRVRVSATSGARTAQAVRDVTIPAP